MDLFGDINNDSKLSDENAPQVLINYYGSKLKTLNNGKKYNHDLVYSIMHIAEIFFNKSQQGLIKKNVCMNALSFSDSEYVDNTIGYIIKNKLLPKKNLINKIKHYF